MTIKVLDQNDVSWSFRWLKNMLMFYWTVFWLLNGLDKFFNAPKWFGVTRDEKFIGYFARIDLPEELALFSFYAIGVYEVLLGLSLVYTFFASRWRLQMEYMNMHLGLLMFLLFPIGDILFGDRRELWEHGTYTILIIATYGVIYLADFLSSKPGRA